VRADCLQEKRKRRTKGKFFNPTKKRQPENSIALGFFTNGATKQTSAYARPGPCECSLEVGLDVGGKKGGKN